MKIAIVITSLEVGGAEKMILDLISGLKERFKVRLYIIKKNNYSIFDSLSLEYKIDMVYLNGNGKIFSIFTAFKLKKLIDSFKPNIIHTNLKSSSYIYFYHLFNKNFKWIHTVHTVANVDCRPFRRILFRNLYNKKIIRLVAVSDFVMESLKQLYKKSNIELIYNGINLDNFKYHRKNIIDQVNICHIGRFTKSKNHYYIINEFWRLSKKFEFICLYLVGDGKLFQKTKRLVNKLGLKDKINFVGYSKDVDVYLQKSHIFWLPSLYEGLPISLIEAMSSGVVCVASKRANNMIIEDEKDGYIVNLISGELSDITEEIICNYNNLEEMRINAIKKASEFSINTMIERYVKLYER